MVVKGQTYIDIAMQELGSAEGALALALANDGSLTDELVPGTDPEITEVQTKDQDTLDYLKNVGFRPSSNDFHTEEEDQEGIGFWAIENDFIVS